MEDVIFLELASTLICDNVSLLLTLQVSITLQKIIFFFLKRSLLSHRGKKHKQGTHGGQAQEAHQQRKLCGCRNLTFHYPYERDLVI